MKTWGLDAVWEYCLCVLPMSVRFIAYDKQPDAWLCFGQHGDSGKNVKTGEKIDPVIMLSYVSDTITMAAHTSSQVLRSFHQAIDLPGGPSAAKQKLRTCVLWTHKQTAAHGALQFSEYAVKHYERLGGKRYSDLYKSHI